MWFPNAWTLELRVAWTQEIFRFEFFAVIVLRIEVRRQSDSRAYEDDRAVGELLLTGIKEKFTRWMRDLENVANGLFDVKNVREIAWVNLCIRLSEI